MSNRRKEQRELPWKWIVIFGSALSPSIFAALIVSQIYSNNGQPISFVRGFAWQAPIFFLWALFVPVIVWAGKNFRLPRGGWAASLPIYIVIGIPLVLAHTVFTVWITQTVKSSSDAQSNLGSIFSKSPILEHLPIDILIYSAIVVVIYAGEYHARFRERERAAKELENQLIGAQLQSLKMQINPHFLFNTLNAISALVHASPNDADETLTQLSDLLRISLKSGKTQEVTLKEELEFLRKYLQIHQTLMGKRLSVEWRIAPETLDAQVPNMILQPLVENSIQHGLAPLVRGGRIEIAAARNNGHLRLSVRDNGRGLSKETATSGTGIGLTNTKARLQHLYGKAHQFKLDEPNDGGLTVDIKIPFRERSSRNQNEDSSDYS